MQQAKPESSRDEVYPVGRGRLIVSERRILVPALLVVSETEGGDKPTPLRETSSPSPTPPGYITGAYGRIISLS